LLTLVAIAATQEVAFRAMFPLPEVDGFNRINYTPVQAAGAEAERLRRQGLCNVKIRYECALDGFAFDHTLNLYGFRGPDFRIDPPVDRPRIVFIGDSFVEGCGAADDDTLPRQFARALEQSGRPVEAINLGVTATSPREYFRIVRDALPLLRAQAVYVLCCMNDLPAPPPDEAVSSPPPAITPLSRVIPRLAQLVYRLALGHSVPRRFLGGPYPFFEPVPSPTNSLTTRPAPPNVDAEVLRAAQAGKANAAMVGVPAHYARLLSLDFTPGSWADLDQRLGFAEAYLQGMAAVCRQHNARLVVLYIPYHALVNPAYIAAQNRLGGERLVALTDPKYRRQEQHLAEVTRRLGIPLIDTTEEFIRAEQSRGRMFWPVDSHCNAAGYGLLADLCARDWTDQAAKSHQPGPVKPRPGTTK
jgi:lysophospholipase L1-like esterase